MTIDSMMLAYARRAQHRLMRGWLTDPNVTLIGLGWKETKDGYVHRDRLALRVHVRRKLSGPALEMADTVPVPRHIGDFPTDVVEGSYACQWWPGGSRSPGTEKRSRRFNQLQGGLSIGNERRFHYGTLGAWVVDRADPGVSLILSNWHMLASDWRALPGQRIYQPGRRDGGRAGDTIATLTRHAMSQNLDAAVATLNDSRVLSPEQFGLGSVTGISRGWLDMTLVKSGRGSALTFGRVTDFGAVARMNFAGLTKLIREVVVIDQVKGKGEVSRAGDSGSLWLNQADQTAVALHFAGQDRPERALAMDIRSVLDALNVALVVAG